MRVPLLAREERGLMELVPVPLEVERMRSGWESEAGLRLRSRGAEGEEEDEGRKTEDEVSLLLWCDCAEGGVSLKMWMVSVAEETQRREEVALKDMLKMREGMEPRRNW